MEFVAGANNDAELNEELIAHTSICAYLSTMVYDTDLEMYSNHPTILARKDSYKPDQSAHLFDSTNWMLCQQDDCLILSFRGSVNTQDWSINVSMQPIPIGNDMSNFIHSGFWGLMQFALPHILLHLRQHLRNDMKLLVTGHSLGGALAQVFSLMYDHDLHSEQRGDLPPVTAVITFAAPQLCIIAEPDAYRGTRDKCLNYACVGDPVPCLPGLMVHPNAGRIVQNHLFDKISIGAFVFGAAYEQLPQQANTLPYVRRYHPFACNLEIAAIPLTNLMKYTSEMHRDLVLNPSRDVSAFNVSAHGMLFYLGELCKLGKLTNDHNEWFDGYNAQVRAGTIERHKQYYDPLCRTMVNINCTWVDRINDIMRYAHVVYLRIACADFLAFTYAHAYGGSEFLFIDANVKSLDELTSQVPKSNNNIVVYPPGDYSWLDNITDMNMFLDSFRRLSEKEQQQRSIDTALVPYDPDPEKWLLGAAKVLELESADVGSKRLAEEILSRKRKETQAADVATPSVFLSTNPQHHITQDTQDPLLLSICTFLNCIMDSPYPGEQSWMPTLLCQYRTGDVTWKIFVNESHIFLCFHAAMCESSLLHVPNGRVETINVDGSDYSITHNLWDAVMRCYPNVIAKLREIKWIDCLIITGNSIGGALAQTFAFMYENGLHPQSPRMDAKSVEAVITFAAPQILCTNAAPEENSLSNKCVNYACSGDPFPRLPELCLHYKLDMLVANMEHDGSNLAAIVSSYILAVKARATSSSYFAFGDTIVMPSKRPSRTQYLKHCSPRAQRMLIHDMNAEAIKGLNVKCHSMQYYAETMQRMNLLSAACAEWVANYFKQG